MALDISILAARIARANKMKVDYSSTSTMYVGLSQDPQASESAAQWSIWRLTQIGTVVTCENAADDDYNDIWDDRASYFSSIILSNQYSTLFDGINDYVSFGNVFNYSTANQWSISMWVRPDNQSSQYALYSKCTADANVYGYGIYIVSSGAIFVQVRGTGGLTSFTGSQITNALAWNHIVVTFSGSSNISGMRVYVNNVVDTTPASAAVTGVLSSQTAMIGARNGGFPLPGYIDEVTIWGKALSLSEVSTIYNGGSPNDPTVQSFSGDLVSYYRMGDGDSYPIILDHVGSSPGTMTNMSGSNFQLVVP